MSKYICTAKIKYTRQEVQLHINALKMALSNPALTNYRGRYEALLKDMKRINNEMFDKENDEFVEYLYECPECDYIFWSDSKKLFKRCPKCFVKRMNNRMRLAL